MNLKVKYNPKFSKEINSILKRLEKDNVVLNEVGIRSTDLLRGFVKSNKDNYKFKELSKDTIEKRKELSESNNVDPAYRIKKPLTFTGQLLNSLTYFIRGGSVFLTFEGMHEPYKNKEGKSIGKPQSNESIAEGIQKKRRFVYLSTRLKELITKRMVAVIRLRFTLYKKLL